MNTVEYVLRLKDFFYQQNGVYPSVLLIHEFSLKQIEIYLGQNLRRAGFVFGMEIEIDNDQNVCSVR